MAARLTILWAADDNKYDAGGDSDLEEHLYKYVLEHGNLHNHTISQTCTDESVFVQVLEII